MEKIVFRRWSNKGWAIFASIHRVVIISVLCVSYQLGAQERQAVSQDTSSAAFNVELEEVEASGQLPAELAEVSLKPVILVSRKDIEGAAAAYPLELLRQQGEIQDTVGGREFNIRFAPDTDEVFVTGAAGKRCEHLLTYWMVWKGIYPETTLYGTTP